MPTVRCLLLSVLLLSGSAVFSQSPLDAVLSGTSNQLSAAQLEALSDFSISIDTVAVHTGFVGPDDLTGFTTVRLYLETSSPDDAVGAIYGVDGTPLYITSTGLFYQHPLGGALGSAILPALVTMPGFESLQYDSWLTIGLEQQPESGEDLSLITSSGPQDWTAGFGLGGPVLISDNFGGTVYALPGSSNTIAGADNKVLVAQLTTDGDINGTLQAQVYLNGDNLNGSVQLTLCINDDNDDADGICNLDESYGCMDETACNYNPDATVNDNGCWYAAPYRDCNYDCLNDADNDGVCDEEEVQGCVTDSLACNFLADATDTVSCTYPDANLDCDGNCLNDVDGDLVCDEDELAGCTDATACNYNEAATDDDDSCTYPAADNLDCEGNCLNDADGDLVCDEDEIGGCTDDAACNFGAAATDDDGSCEYTSCAGCTDSSACNYDGASTIDDGSCTYPAAANLDCDGNCLNDADGDLVCDEDEIAGCTDAAACNYSEAATDDDDSCTYPAAANLDCDGNCLNDADGDLVCDEDEIAGCTDAAACNYSEAATDDDDSCTYPAAANLDCDGNCLNDADGDLVCDEDEIAGCTDAAACNYSEAATDDDDSCTYPAAANLDCDGNCLNDADGDLVCDEDEIAGCTDATACNYSEAATDDDDSCTYPAAANLDCDGNCLNDADGDLVCDEDEIAGCTDAAACNYSEAATDDDDSCTYPAAANLDCDGNCLNDADGDLVCDEDEIAGCTDATACNYSEAATDDDDSCTYPAAANLDCDGNCLNDADGDLVCDEDEIAGCTDATACNYSEAATDDDDSCTYPAAANLDCDGNCLNDADGDLVCDEDEIAGCTDAAACNYSEAATDDDDSCTYPAAANLDCDGNCLNDADGDLVCDEDEIAGCTDATACNYDEAATEDDASCTYPAAANLDCDGNCLNDADGDLVCDEDEIAGCTDAAACNYDEAATEDDASCTYPAAANLDCDGNCLNDADGDLVCDEDEIAGCTDATACNYDEAATEDDASCTYPAAANLDCDGNCLNDADGDLVCDEDEIAGCTDATACNYDEAATEDDASCTYPAAANLDCDGNCLNDADGDLVCDEDEIAGCTDATACNYSEAATDDDDSCTYPAAANLDCDGNCLNDADGDLVCDEDEIAGCTDAAACNYDEAATEDDASCDYTSCAGCTDATACNYDETSTLDDGTCTYPDAANLDCDGNCLNDTDGDLICDEDEIAGCTDAAACNFDAMATDDDESCTFADPNLDCDGNCLNDADGDLVCDEDEVAGCTDADACNYDADATDDDSSCAYPAADNLDCDGNCLNDADNDGLCDEDDNCADILACNYDDPANVACLELDFCGECGGPGPGPGLDCDGNPVDGECNIDCIVTSESLADQVLNCPDDFDNVGCDPTITAYNNCTDDLRPVGVSCQVFDFRTSRSTCAATTADGIGQDGALVLFGVTSFGVSSTYYVPSGPGLTLEEDGNGAAVLTGQVQGVSDPDEKWNVSIVYEDGVSGADWQGGFKTAMNCTPTQDITDAWTIYQMKDDQAVLTGEGALSGSILFLSHAPANEYFGFQVGEMANDRNCNYGAGGWFGWQGTIHGNPNAQGANGDVLVDLACGGNQNSNGCTESMEILYSFVDTACPNVINTLQTFTYLDTVGPAFDNAPEDVTVSCSDDLPALSTLTATDNCLSSPVTVSFLGEATVDSTGPGCYSFERTWSALDACGNTAVHTQTITVADDTPPTFLGGENGSAECGGDVMGALDTWLADHGGAELSDDCGEATWGATIMAGMSGGCGETGSTTYGFIATDACGNSDTLLLDFNVVDTTPPVVFGAQDTLVACGDFDPDDFYGITATDACSDAEDIEISILEETVVTGGCGNNHFRTYLIEDACGISTTYEQVVTLYDSVPPVVTLTSCPDSVVLEVDGLCNADTSPEALGSVAFTVVDACDASPTDTSYHTDVVTSNCAGHLRIERTWTAIGIDACDRTDTATCVQLIEVLDNVAPTLSLTCPDSLTIAKDDLCSADTSPDALGYPDILTEDACGGAVGLDTAYVDSDTLDLCTGAFSFTRTWTITATDECGNPTTASCSHVITVEDQTAPVLTVTDTLEVACDLFHADSLYATSATDNCSGVDIAITAQTEGDLSCAGSVHRTLTATDSCGNATSADQVLLLIDTVDPGLTLSGPADTTLVVDALCAADTSAATLGMATAEASDNCGLLGVNITYEDAVADSCGSTFAVTRTWTATATDACGNDSTLTHVQTILLVDETKPSLSIECPSDTTVYADADCMVALAMEDVSLPAITTDDNCPEDPAVDVSFADSDTTVHCTGQYSFLRTWTVTASDACGNDSTVTCSHTIHVEDTLAPVVTAEILVTMDCSVYDEEALYAIDAVDNCSAVTIEVDTNSEGSGACAGTWIRDYIITDECGNIEMFQQIIDLTDSIAPEVTIECPANDTLQVDADCFADTDPALTGMATASCTDNCDLAPDTVISYSDVLIPLCTGSTRIERTWMAVGEDHCGNTDTATCVQIILLEDLIAPTVELAALDTAFVTVGADCDAATPTDLTGIPTYTTADNCDGPVQVELSFSDGDTLADCGDTYHFTRTWVALATDSCGNQSTDTTQQVIQLLDETAPDWGNALLYTYAECDLLSDPTDPTQVPIEATDNCSEVTYSIEAEHFSGGCPGTYERIWTATDACGNASTISQFVVLYDPTAPEITCPDSVTLILDDACSADLDPALLGTATATDNCASEEEITITYEDAPATVTCTGDDDTPEGSRIIERMWLAEDLCENVDTCIQVLTLLDTLAPIATLENDTVLCELYDASTEYGAFTAEDNCDSDVAYTWQQDSVQSGDCVGSYTVYRSYTFTDDCGNATTLQQTVEVIDETAPVVLGDMMQIVACQVYDQSPELTYITATDNCGDVTIDFTDTPFSGGCVQPAGTFMRDYTVIDDCGNTTMFTQFIELIDTIPPSLFIECPPADTLFTDDACGFDADTSITGVPAIDVSDNCCVDIELTTTYEDGPADTSCTGSLSFVRTFTVVAEDDCFLTTEAICTQLITVLDATAPVLDCPADTTVQCDPSNANVFDAWMAEIAATDNCSDSVTITSDTFTLTTPCSEALTVTFYAEDACGNVDSCQSTFTIIDTIAPVLTPAMDMTVQCDGMDNQADLDAWLADNGGATASDVCSDATFDPEPTLLSFADSCGATGVFTYSFTARDECGNADSTVATFTIIDTVAPVFADTGAFHTIACDLYDSTEVYLVSAEDVCGLAIVTITGNDEVTGTCPASYLRTYTATDACGNTSTFEQQINLIDTVAPAFDFVPEGYTALCHEAHPLESATAYDNCADNVDITTTADTTAGDCPQSYTVTRTFLAVDDCDNETVATQVIQIIDTLAPVFVEALPADTTVDCHAVPAADVLTATDLCQDVEVLFTEDTVLSAACIQSYTLTRTWSVSDDCGNANEHVQVVTVVDTLAPSIDEEAMSMTVECDGLGNGLAFQDWLDSLAGASASDLCSPVTALPPVIDTVSADCDGAVLDRLVHFVFSDDCGNTDTTSASFTILDTTSPTASADSLFMVMCADYDATEAYGFTASDVCSDTTVVIVDEPLEGESCAGAFTRTYTVSDACGNDTVLTQIVHLYDSIAPIFTHVPNDTILLCNELWNLDSLGEAMAEDNCLGSVTISSQDSVLASDSLDVDCYVVERLWTATDVCGNQKSVTQTITIADTLAPGMTPIYPLDAVLYADAEDCSADISTDLYGVAVATADDNCDDDVPVEVVYADSVVPTCGGARDVLRTWTLTATDNCGNTSTLTHVQTLSILDTTPPILTAAPPANITVYQTPGCDVYLAPDSLGEAEFMASDNCDTNVVVNVFTVDGEPEYTCETSDSLAEGDYNFTRTFTVIATDACTNADTVVVEQFIHVMDTLAPQFTNTCGILNDDVVHACCEGEGGLVNIPDSCGVQVVDNCDTEVELTYTETYVGDYAPTEDVLRFCSAATPAPFEDGETCNGFTPHSLRLFNLGGGAEFYTATSPGTVTHNADGTWTLTQSVLATDGSGGGWNIETTYSEAQTWDEWSSQDFPTSFKRDCGDLVDDHENWEYRIMESGTLTGTGTYDGSFFNLSHAPANQYYAFQIGLGANNMNNAYGYSGWFNYAGTFNGMMMMGSGDFFGELDCCLPWAINREYMVVDDCSNVNTFAYTVSVNGGGCNGDVDAGVSGNGDADHTPGILSGAGDITTGKSPIRVTNLQPNPTNDWSQLGFEVTGNMRVVVSMFTMDGVLVEELFDGVAGPGINHSLDIDADQLESGMYQIRLSNTQYMIVKKLLVTE